MKSLPHKWKVKRDKIVKIKKIEYIKNRAYFIWMENKLNKKKEIAEYAYHLSLKNQDNSAYANWCQAANEYKNLRSKQ